MRALPFAVLALLAAACAHAPVTRYGYTICEGEHAWVTIRADLLDSETGTWVLEHERAHVEQCRRYGPAEFDRRASDPELSAALEREARCIAVSRLSKVAFPACPERKKAKESG